MEMVKKFFLASAVIALGFVAVAPSPSLAQVTKSGSKYKFRMKWVKGAHMAYGLEMTQVGSTAKPMQMGLVYDVLSVANGVGTVQATVSNAGQQPQKETVKIDDRGRASGGSNVAGFSNILEFPAEAVAVGGSWKTNASLPGMGGSKMTGTATNTLKGFRTEGGKSYAYVTTDLNVSGGGVSGKGKTDSLISMADGQLLRTSMALKMTISTKDSKGKTVTQSIDLTVKMTRK